MFPSWFHQRAREARKGPPVELSAQDWDAAQVIDLASNRPESCHNVHHGESWFDIMQASTLRATAEDDADRILKNIWHENTLPVNPVQIAKRLGIEVYEAQLPLDVSGMFMRDEEGNDKIYLDVDDNVNRRRFTCAHELGHYARLPKDSEPTVSIERRDTVATQGKDPEEIYANSFAAALLMPRFAIRELLKAGVGVAQIARSFNVSQQSLNYRIDNLSRDGQLR